MQITKSAQLRPEHLIKPLTPGLFRVYEASDNETRSAVVFVHGFRSNSIDTWGLDDNTKYFWPIEIGIATHTDIYCLEYLNGWTKIASRAPLPLTSVADSLLERVRDVLTRYDRVTFVAHSFGGILAKEIYSRLAGHADPGLSSLAHRVVGIYFLSCPHMGHWLAYGAKFIIGRFISFNFKLLGSSVLAANNTTFLRHYQNSRGNLYCETLGETGKMWLVFRVGPERSRLRDDIEHTDDERNHSAIVKSLNQDDEIFKKTVSFVTKQSTKHLRDPKALGVPLWQKR